MLGQPEQEHERGHSHDAAPHPEQAGQEPGDQPDGDGARTIQPPSILGIDSV